MLSTAAGHAASACQSCAPLAEALQYAVAGELASLETAAQEDGDLMALQKKVDELQANVAQALSMLKTALGESLQPAGPSPTVSFEVDDTHSRSQAQVRSEEEVATAQPKVAEAPDADSMRPRILSSPLQLAAPPTSMQRRADTHEMQLLQDQLAAPEFFSEECGASNPMGLASALGNVAADMREALEAIRVARQSKTCTRSGSRPSFSSRTACAIPPSTRPCVR